MSHSQFHSIKLFILRHAWLNLWDKHMTTGRINQVTVLRLTKFYVFHTEKQIKYNKTKLRGPLKRVDECFSYIFLVVCTGTFVYKKKQKTSAAQQRAAWLYPNTCRTWVSDTLLASPHHKWQNRNKDNSTLPHQAFPLTSAIQRTTARLLNALKHQNCKALRRTSDRCRVP